MTEKVNEKVSVYSWYDRIKSEVKIMWVRWNGRNYKILHHDYHMKRRIGRVVFHEFFVASDTLSFRLLFDPDTLFWTLEEISDGNAH